METQNKQITAKEAYKIVEENLNDRSSIAYAEVNVGRNVSSLGGWNASNNWRKRIVQNYIGKYSNSNFNYCCHQTQSEIGNHTDFVDWYKITSKRDNDGGELEEMTLQWTNTKQVMKGGRN